MSEAVPSEFVDVFCDEASDTLLAWEKQCLELERGRSPETYDALFRAAHNIKGSARCLQFDALGEFVHKVEDVITLGRSNAIETTADLVALFLSCQSLLLTWVGALRTDHNYLPKTDDLLKKLAAFESLKNGSAGASSVKESAVAPTLSDEDVKRVPANVVPIVKSVAAPVVAAAPVSAPAPATPAAVMPPPDASPKGDETIRVSAHKLDLLLQVIGELSIQQSIIWHGKQSGVLNAPPNCQNAIYLTNKITKEIQNQALALRMQPLTQLFQRMERVARDIAREQSKSIIALISGDQVELDKSVIERITDPLTHILRNAVDHGVETKTERQKAGKSQNAIVTLKAEQSVSGVTLVISDDGRGLNREKILAKAVDMGLVAPGTKMSDKEICKLIMLPGVSTAEQLSNISGRGVGMDVVKKSLEDLGGSIEIDSVVGKGTTFYVGLPTSVSIVDALIVDISGGRYAIPIQEMSEIVDLSQFKIDTSTQKGRMISLRGRVVPLEDLSEYFCIPNATGNISSSSPGGPKSSASTKTAVVCMNDDEQVAFEVDKVLGSQSIVVRQLQGSMKDLKGLSGNTILGDGDPGLIIDLRSCLKSYLGRVRAEGGNVVALRPRTEVKKPPKKVTPAGGDGGAEPAGEMEFL